MRVRSLTVCGSLLVVSAFAFAGAACSSPDPFYGPSTGSGANGSGSGSDAGSSAGNPSSSGGGTSLGGGGGADASSGTSPPPASSDAGSTTAHDAGGPPSGGSDAGPPASGNDAAAPTDGFDEFQHRNLDDVNKYRATLNVAPLVLDATLCTFAVAGSLELSQDHTPHQHFITASNNGSLWTSGFNSTAAENQGDPNGWTKLATDPTQNELQQIDAIQLAMFDEGPGTGEAHGHYTNMMDATSTRLGVGLLEVNGMLYLTNDFSQ